MNELYFDKNSYLNFDALSLKSLIVDKLNKGKVFTDQNYQGSNLSAVIDIISLVFGNLLFYLNKTSSESMFSEAQLYENMNRIVKLLGYKPVGKLASVVPIRLSVRSNIPINNYTIPRYSYIQVGDTNFSFSNDVFFTKLNEGVDENITSIDDKNLLKQGIYEEYPIYNANGFDNEVVYLSLDENVFIDHYSIDVYVKEANSSQWVKYSPVNELFLHSANETVYEIRYNENKRYEITFGNNINGKKLNLNDQVLVYYLRTDTEEVNLGSGAIENNFIIRFNSLLYPQVLDDTNSVNANYLSQTELRSVLVRNFYPSTSSKTEETVDNIRKNAPQAFRSQYRLITKKDFEVYIKNNYSNFIKDVKIMNNNDYLLKYMKYLYDIGLKNPHKEFNLLFNQVKFSNACNFNNLYICAAPKTENQAFLNPTQKEIVINGLDPWKTLTTELVPLDPVYMMFDFFVPTEDLSLDDLSSSILRIFKNKTSNVSDSEIITQIKQFFENQFSSKNSTLGQYLDLNKITTDLLSINGVDSIRTFNKKTNQYTDGISLLGWNFYYPENDKKIYTQNVLFDDFKIPVFNNLTNLATKIEIYKDPFTLQATQF